MYQARQGYSLYMIKFIQNISSARFCLVILLWAAASIAQARDYVIEVVMFENTTGRTAANKQLYYPKITDAIGLSSEQAAATGFSIIDSNLSLSESAESIKTSSRYRLIRHFAWQQPGLDEEHAVAIRINLGDQQAVFIPENITSYTGFIPAALQVTADKQRQIMTTSVNGTLKVILGRFLHLESQLVFTDFKQQQSFRLSQSRKMRSRELHYIDNKRFGILVQILPVEDPS